mmetsp:Transcript_5667/g.8972  ORF Transcript_5667/g.8972 Transcript_5667/m.8972 type:complete len:237 (-) Transcript_5667:823-1533(-)
MLFFANIGGVGGGGIVVPIAIGLFKFDAKNAIAVSNFSIFLASCIRWIMNARLSHPLKKGKGIIVDMNLSVLMLPMIISGVSFGVIFNIMFPNILIKVFYVVILIYLGFGLFKKGFSLYANEKKAIQDKLEASKAQEGTDKEGGEAVNDSADIAGIASERQDFPSTENKVDKKDNTALGSGIGKTSEDHQDTNGHHPTTLAKAVEIDESKDVSPNVIKPVTSTLPNPADDEQAASK